MHSSIGLESWDLGDAGDCFFHCIAPLVGMTVLELRRCQHMRDNEQIYGCLGDFESQDERGGFEENRGHVLRDETTLSLDRPGSLAFSCGFG